MELVFSEVQCVTTMPVLDARKTMDGRMASVLNVQGRAWPVYCHSNFFTTMSAIVTTLQIYVSETTPIYQGETNRRGTVIGLNATASSWAWFRNIDPRSFFHHAACYHAEVVLPYLFRARSLSERKCFRCLRGDMIIAAANVCDGIIDCADMSDECACASGTPEICQQVVTRSLQVRPQSRASLHHKYRHAVVAYITFAQCRPYF